MDRDHDRRMKAWVAAGLGLGLVWSGAWAGPEGAELTAPPQRVYVVPVQGDIMPPLTYVVRRGVKEAMEAKADVLVLDMDTNGGRVDVTEEILEIVGRFPGKTITYVNTKAFSAGAFIAVGTSEIYMADEAVIGAAAPMMVVPGGGPTALPESVEAKMTSGIKAMIRAKAERHGHNVDVIEAMIDRNKELVVDGVILNPKGQILTLTASEAVREYGDPPKPLLSAGTYSSLDAMLEGLGYGAAQRVEIRPTGAEQLAFWLNAISPLLLALGLVGIYLEFKTPGFGVPGAAAISALLLYFLGTYIAGLSGIEWIGVFALGLILIALEIFLFPGTLALGMTGAGLLLVSLVMAAADWYPGMPRIPSLPQLHVPLRNLAISGVLAVVAIWVLGMVLPKTPAYAIFVSQGTSGLRTDERRTQERMTQVGREGVAMSVLRPGGKGLFGDEILDVVTRGEMVPRGARLRIIAHSGPESVVEEIVG
jgi:membrane-bound serine protease (ClpP class)